MGPATARGEASSHSSAMDQTTGHSPAGLVVRLALWGQDADMHLPLGGTTAWVVAPYGHVEGGDTNGHDGRNPAMLSRVAYHDSTDGVLRQTKVALRGALEEQYAVASRFGGGAWRASTLDVGIIVLGRQGRREPWAYATILRDLMFEEGIKVERPVELGVARQFSGLCRCSTCRPAHPLSTCDTGADSRVRASWCGLPPLYADGGDGTLGQFNSCLLYTSPSPRDS